MIMFIVLCLVISFFSDKVCCDLAYDMVHNSAYNMVKAYGRANISFYRLDYGLWYSNMVQIYGLSNNIVYIPRGGLDVGMGLRAKPSSPPHLTHNPFILTHNPFFYVFCQWSKW